MIRKWLTKTGRIFLRRKYLTLINVFGLSVGITACLLIFIHVADELKYDRHHDDSKSIYRLLMVNPNSGNGAAILAGAAYPYLLDKVPGVEQIARIDFRREWILRSGEKPFVEYGFIAADPCILDMFTFNFLEGDPATALNDAHSIIITPEAAARYFGQDDPLGKTLSYSGFNFTVTAIVEPFPEQSHFGFSIVGNIECIRTINSGAMNDWGNQSHYYYLKLDEEADPRLVSQTIQDLIWDVKDTYRDRVFYALQPLEEVRLYSKHIEWDIARKGDISMVWIFSVSALLILLLACFNFINLTTAGATNRSREIGVKKILGASRSQLIRQFLGETFLLTLLSAVLALLFVELLMPGMRLLTGKHLSLQILFQGPGLLIIGAILILVPLLAGWYPAVILSRFRAVNVLKGAVVVTSIKGLKKRKYQLRLRQLLLLLQFAVSVFLIIFSFIIFMQMKYVSESDQGYERNTLMAVINPWDDNASARSVWFREKLLQHPDVRQVSLTHNVPPAAPNNYSRFSYPSDAGNNEFHGAVIACDEHFFSTMGSEIIQGKDFSKHPGIEQQLSVIINKTAAERMEVDNPEGVIIKGFYDGKERKIVGIVEDIYYNSFHEPVLPMVFYINHDSYPQNWFKILLKFREGAAKDVLGYAEKVWAEGVPDWPFRYSFIEQQVESQYTDERRVMMMVSSFTSLAIFLCLLGLIGLAIFSTLARRKEIGIRKVLGASGKSIVKLFTNELTLLVLLSNIIAWPAAWLLSKRWLGNFVYSIEINWWMFVIAGVIVYVVSVIVVTLLSIKAARINPGIILKSE